MLRNSPATTALDQSMETPRLGQLMSLAGTWLQRWRSRQALGELDERLLRDIGISPLEAIGESAMPFWKPFTWLHRK